MNYKVLVVFSERKTTSKSTRTTTYASKPTQPPDKNVIGLVYKTNNTDISKVMTGIQDLVTTLQSEACAVFKNSNELKEKFKMTIDQLVLKGNENVDCTTLLKNLSVARSVYVGLLSEFEVESKIKINNKGLILDKIIAIVKSAVEVSCVNNTIDILKLRKLLNDLMDAICY